jgi:hypothetical protein
VNFTEERPFASVDAAVRKLLEIATDHAGRLQIGTVNGQFIAAGASPSEYKAALRAAIERGYLIMHPSGGYVTFTQEGADLFA